MSFLDDDFLLLSDVARTLYHDYARDLPIYDYHCHLPPADIAANRRFENLYDIWLAGDHYKWRAMRTNGIAEEFCTGKADPYAKFLAWARTVPATLRNPLYHWTHLELQRYFGIRDLLDEHSAPAIWERANSKLAEPDFHVFGIFEKFRVDLVCTTDDPTDSLEHHIALKSAPTSTTVLPTFRPDKALHIGQADAFRAYCDQLEAVSGCSTSTLKGFLEALRSRHEFFHSVGCRLSDHGLEVCFADFPDPAEAARIFERVRNGGEATPGDAIRFASHLMLEFGRWDAEAGWVKQLHLGALRGNNSRAAATLGPDTGFDSIGDWSQAENLARYLDALDRDNRLPKMILYNLNPADNYTFATMIGNFQDGSTPGKIQWGSGWWFLDQKQGMEWQINALSNLGLLAHFVGMLTDSRSFLSYPRHEYFRRILCNMIGEDVVRGELPDDIDLLGRLVANISYHNAASYFPMERNASGLA